MKKNINFKKLFKYISLAAILLLVTFIMYSLRSTAENGDYTSYSTGYNGVKALYLLTGKMGFDAERFEKSARFLPLKATLVIVYPDEAAINDELEIKYLRKWVENGNALIIASDRDLFINYKIASGIKSSQFGGITDDTLIAGRMGKGWLLLFDGAEELENEHINGVDYAVSFLKILSQAGFKKVYFNEYYHYLNDSGPLVLDIIGSTGRLILFQLAIALAAFIIILWRRFGRPVEVFENIKRIENENMLAISNLYIRSKAEDIVLGTYLNSFRAELSRYLGLENQADNSQLSAAAVSDKLLKGKNIGALLDKCDRFIQTGTGNKERRADGSRRKNVRHMLHLVESIEEIRREIR